MKVTVMLCTAIICIVMFAIFIPTQVVSDRQQESIIQLLWFALCLWVIGMFHAIFYNHKNKK